MAQSPNPIPWTRTACRGAACLLETNIRTLSDAVSHTASNVTDMLALETRNVGLLGDAGKANYLEHALSSAVDMQPGTVFRSLTRTSVLLSIRCSLTFPYLDAAQGDIITLDLLTDISVVLEWTAVELVWLVDSPTENILKSCTFEWSSDNTTWVSSRR